MNAIENDVRALVDKELAAANERFPQFHSAHEGWAVILEEVIETEAEMKTVRDSTEGMFRFVLNNADAKCAAKKIEYAAIHAACEAIQVAAMCRKFMGMEAENEEEIDTG